MPRRAALVIGLGLAAVNTPQRGGRRPDVNQPLAAGTGQVKSAAAHLLRLLGAPTASHPGNVADGCARNGPGRVSARRCAGVPHPVRAYRLFYYPAVEG